MPAALPFIIAATALAGTGITAYEAFNKPSGPDPAALQQQQQQDALKAKQAQDAQKLQMLRKAAPDAQAAAGGSLTDQGFSQLVANIAGLPGDINLAQELLKPGSNTAPGGSGTTNNPAFSITPTDSSISTPGSPFGTGTQRGESGVSGAHIENLQQAIDFLSGGQASEHVSG